MKASDKDKSGECAVRTDMPGGRAVCTGIPGERGAQTVSRRQFIGGLGAGSLVAAALAGSFNPLATISAFAVPTSAEKQAEAEEVKKKLDAWAEQLDKATTDYYLAIEAHDKAIVDMQEAQDRIEAAETNLTDLQNKLAARATAMYKEGQLSFLDVLFGSHSFSEFTTSWDMANAIGNEDATMIERSKQVKKDAQTARDDYASNEKLAQQKLDEADEIKQQAEQTVADYQATLESLEKEIADLIQKEREEEERRLREINNANYVEGWGDGSTNLTEEQFGIIVAMAYEQLGTPYVWGGTTPFRGLDCSGLTQYCYRQAGISIPRVDTSQRAAARSALPVSLARPGDILWKMGHVGIYIGGGQYIHAPQPGDVVRVASNMGMWSNTCRY
jgi:cell wall-associated NlpC family hydrolase